MTNQRVRSGKPDLSIAIGNIRLGGLRDGCINRVERWDVPAGCTSRNGVESFQDSHHHSSGPGLMRGIACGAEERLGGVWIDRAAGP